MGDVMALHSALIQGVKTVGETVHSRAVKWVGERDDSSVGQMDGISAVCLVDDSVCYWAVRKEDLIA